MVNKRRNLIQCVLSEVIALFVSNIKYVSNTYISSIYHRCKIRHVSNIKKIQFFL